MIRLRRPPAVPAVLLNEGSQTTQRDVAEVRAFCESSFRAEAWLREQVAPGAEYSAMVRAYLVSRGFPLP